MGKGIHTCIHHWLGSEVKSMLHKLSSVYLVNDKTLIFNIIPMQKEIK